MNFEVLLDTNAKAESKISQFEASLLLLLRVRDFSKFLIKVWPVTMDKNDTSIIRQEGRGWIFCVNLHRSALAPN